MGTTDAQVHKSAPSLQRLLALDKSFDSLQDRINEAARILDITLDQQKGLSQAQSLVTNYGRHEFVLRWLFEKLKTQTEARACSSAWTLAARLVEETSVASCAKCLASVDPLSIVATTLAENISEDHLEALSGSEAEAGLTKDKHADKRNGAGKESKKRRRELEATSTQTNGPRQAEVTQRLADAVTFFAGALLSKAGKPSDDLDNTSKNQMQATIRLSTPELVRLTRYWFEALVFLHSQPAAAGLEASSPSHFLQLLTEIWSAQSIQLLADQTTAVRLFCDECLYPAMRLLWVLQRDLEARPALQVAIRLVSSLIAQHALLPARAAFHEKSRRAPNQSASDVKTDSFLVSISARVRALEESSSTSTGKRDELLQVLGGLPYLLDVAVRCTKTATPSGKRLEMPWLNSVFTELTDLINPTTSISIDVSPILIRMLEAFSKRSLIPAADILDKFVKTHCLTSLEKAGQLSNKSDFLLIAKIIDMDAGTFTDTKTGNAVQLLDRLSRSAYIEKAPDAQLSAAERAQADLVTVYITIPLMKAFARVRGLQQFLRQWFRSLRTSAGWRKYRWYAWTDGRLQRALADVLEPSLNAIQIRELLEVFAEPLGTTHTASDSLTEPQDTDVSNVDASIVILNALLGAMRSDATIDDFYNDMANLIEKLETLCGSIYGKKTHLPPVELWSLLARLYELWYPLRSSKSLNTTAGPQEPAVPQVSLFERPSVVRAQALARKAKKGDKTPTHVDAWQGAIDFLFSICDLQKSIPERQQDLTQCFENCILPTSHTSEGLGTILVAFGRHPHLWSTLSLQTRRELYQKTLALQTESDTASIHDSLRKKVWGEFVSGVTRAAPDRTRSEDFEIIFELLYPSDHLSGTGSGPERDTWIQYWPLSTLPRPQREKLLDHVLSVFLPDSRALRDKKISILADSLTLAIQLCASPNATSKIATDPSLSWTIAEGLDQCGQDATTIALFEELCRLNLRHIIDTLSQDRSKDFIETFAKTVYKQCRDPESLLPARLRLCAVFIHITETTLPAAELEQLPHRSRKAVRSLGKVSNTVDHVATVTTCQSLALVPRSFWSIDSDTGPEDVLRLPHPSTDLDAKASIARLALASESQLLNTSIQAVADVLGHDLEAPDTHQLLTSLETIVHEATAEDVLSLLSDWTGTGQSMKSNTLRVVDVVLRSLDRNAVLACKSSPDAMALLPNLLTYMKACNDYSVHAGIVCCINSLLREKASLANQYSIEATLATVHRITSVSSPDLPALKACHIFEGLCSIVQSLFQYHRSSLGGRMHLVLPVLQGLLGLLFSPHSSSKQARHQTFNHPKWLDTRHYPLKAKQARVFARLLTLLCNPPHSIISNHRNTTNTQTNGNRNSSTPSSLVDETRKHRIHLGRSIHHLLHAYCLFQLDGRLGQGVKDALTPGIWALMDIVAMDRDEEARFQALGAGMTGPEFAILKRELQEWRQFGRWKGG